MDRPIISIKFQQGQSAVEVELSIFESHMLNQILANHVDIAEKHVMQVRGEEYLAQQNAKRQPEDVDTTYLSFCAGKVQRVAQALEGTIGLYNKYAKIWSSFKYGTRTNSGKEG